MTRELSLLEAQLLVSRELSQEILNFIVATLTCWALADQIVSEHALAHNLPKALVFAKEVNTQWRKPVSTDFQATLCSFFHLCALSVHALRLPRKQFQRS